MTKITFFRMAVLANQLVALLFMFTSPTAKVIGWGLFAITLTLYVLTEMLERKQRNNAES